MLMIYARNTKWEIIFEKEKGRWRKAMLKHLRNNSEIMVINWSYDEWISVKLVRRYHPNLYLDESQQALLVLVCACRLIFVKKNIQCQAKKKRRRRRRSICMECPVFFVLLLLLLSSLLFNTITNNHRMTVKRQKILFFCL